MVFANSIVCIALFSVVAKSLTADVTSSIVVTLVIVAIYRDYVLTKFGDRDNKIGIMS